MPTYEAWTRSMTEADHGVFFVNPFWGLMAMNDIPALDTFRQGRPYLYKIRITLKNPLIVPNIFEILTKARSGKRLKKIEEIVFRGREEASAVPPQKPGLKRRLEALGYDGAVMYDPAYAGKKQVFLYHVFDTNQIEVLEGPTFSGLRSAWPRWR